MTYRSKSFNHRNEADHKFKSEQKNIAHAPEFRSQLQSTSPTSSPIADLNQMRRGQTPGTQRQEPAPLANRQI